MRLRLQIILTAALVCVTVLLLAGCFAEPITVPAGANAAMLGPANQAVTDAARASAAADAARHDRDSKLVASLEVIGRQNSAAPASPQQIVIAAENTFALKLMDGVTITAEDRASAAEREILLSTGRTEEARRLYAEAAAKADALNARIAAAETERDAALARAASALATAERQLSEQQAAHEAAMTKLQARHTVELSAARQKAEAREKFWQTIIFSGLGAACILGGVAMLALKAYVPAFGAQAAVWLFLAGGALVMTGILVRAISRLIDDHPAIFWGGIVTACIGIAITVGLTIANRHHAQPSGGSSPLITTVL